MHKARFPQVSAMALLPLLAAAVAMALPVTFVVTSTADFVTGCATTGTPASGTGGCTLRDAILFSNSNPPASPAQNLIAFDNYRVRAHYPGNGDFLGSDSDDLVVVVKPSGED